MIKTQNYIGQINIENLVGAWTNVNSVSEFIGDLYITHGDSGLVLSINHCSDEHLQQQFNIMPLTTGKPGLAAGFRYFEPENELVIAANEKNGVLVLQCYRQMTAQGGKCGLLTREFYARSESLVANMPMGLYSESNVLAGEGYNIIDLNKIIGKWVNTNKNTDWVSEFTIRQHQEKLSVLSFSEQRKFEWPSCQLTPYHMDQNEFGFVAVSHDSQVNSLFSAYSNKGLIVLSSFHEFKSPDMLPVFNREFYISEPS